MDSLGVVPFLATVARLAKGRAKPTRTRGYYSHPLKSLYSSTVWDLIHHQRASRFMMCVALVVKANKKARIENDHRRAP
jgi:hypothetical protein